METSNRQIQERIGAVMQKLAQLEQRAAVGSEPVAIRGLLKDFHRLLADMESAFDGLRERTRHYAERSREIDLAARRATALMELSPLPYLLVDDTGTIIQGNPAAADTLNLSERHLRDKPFGLFLQAGRDQFLGWLQRLGQDGEVERCPVVLRPRERSARPFTLVATRETPERIALILAGVPAGEASRVES